jgi:hypothetical protein
MTDDKFLPKKYSESFAISKSSEADPDPWLALYLDRSIPIDDEAKAAMLISMRSKSREILFPLLKPILWLVLHLVTVIRIIVVKNSASDDLFRLETFRFAGSKFYNFAPFSHRLRDFGVYRFKCKRR